MLNILAIPIKRRGVNVTKGKILILVVDIPARWAATDVRCNSGANVVKIPALYLLRHAKANDSLYAAGYRSSSEVVQR